MSLAAPSVTRLAQLERNRRVAVLALCAALSVPFGLYAAARAGTGNPLAVGVVAVLFLPVVLWRSLRRGLFVLLGGALLVEQFRYTIGGTGLDAITDRVPLFSSIGSDIGVSGVSISPVEALILAVLATWLLKNAVAGTLRVPRSAMAASIALLAGCAVVAFAAGAARGGTTSVAVYELRPFLYLGIVYLLASQLFTDRAAVTSLLWTVVAVTGVKAVQGVYIVVMARHVQPAPEALLAHEEAFFFGLFLTVTLALWLFDIAGGLRRAATALVPLVLIADLGNHRRVAWLLLAVDLAVLLAVAYRALPHKRRTVRRVAATLAVASAIYLPVFWGSTSMLGEPARAVSSMVSPSARDDSSDRYRSLENANLGLDIRAAGPFGTGFGIPIDYSIPIPDISGTDSFIAYIPHNGVLWVWLRMGVAGELALWSLIAAGIVTGCRLARSRDRLTAALGAVGACAVAQYLVMGSDDLGIYWFRIAIVMGCVLGALEAARRREADAATVVEGAPARGVRRPGR